MAGSYEYFYRTGFVPQLVWEIHIDSVLKLGRAVKSESNDDNHKEEPR